MIPDNYVIPEKYRARIENVHRPHEYLKYLERLGILPQTETEWDILMNTQMKAYPRTLPSIYEGSDLLAEGLLTIKQAAEFLQLGESTLYKLMEAGKLPFHKLGKSRRIPKVALRIYAEKG